MIKYCLVGCIMPYAAVHSSVYFGEPILKVIAKHHCLVHNYIQYYDNAGLLLTSLLLYSTYTIYTCVNQYYLC